MDNKEKFVLVHKRNGQFLKGVNNNRLVYTSNADEAMIFYCRESAENNLERYGIYVFDIKKVNKV